jgi:hypothetical protein
MGERSDQIERHIRETRDELGDNFNELGEKVKSAVDWRAQFEERPWTLMGAAFGAGMLLSAILPSGSRASTNQWSGESRWPSSSEAPGASFRPVTSSSTSIDSTVSKASETLDHLKGALIGLATSKLGTFIEDLVPGFSEEFNKAKNKGSNRFDSSSSSSTTSASSPSSPTGSWQKANAAGAD